MYILVINVISDEFLLSVFITYLRQDVLKIFLSLYFSPFLENHVSTFLSFSTTWTRERTLPRMPSYSAQGCPRMLGYNVTQWGISQMWHVWKIRGKQKVSQPGNLYCSSTGNNSLAVTCCCRRKQIYGDVVTGFAQICFNGLFHLHHLSDIWNKLSYQ